MLACFALAGCDRVFGIGDPYEDARPLDARPEYRKSITIAQPTAATLADFSTSILIENDADLLTHAANDGNIGFVDGTGEPLPCEIVRYDGATGTLDAWVRIAALPPAPDTVTIDLAYGRTQVPCSHTEAWPASAVGAWHSELANDRTLDSTVHVHDLEKVSATSIPQADKGIVGNALLYDGVDDSLCDDADNDNSLAFGTSSFSYVAWLYDSTALGFYDSPFGRGGYSGAPGFALFLGSDVWQAFAEDDTHSQPVTADLLPDAALGRWIQLGVVVDRENQVLRTYVDGAATGTGSLAGETSLTSAKPLCESPSSSLFHGLVDEIQIHAATLPPEWFAAQYANVMLRGQMIVIGAER